LVQIEIYFLVAHQMVSIISVDEGLLGKSWSG
jgi:hypothetical protein